MKNKLAATKKFIADHKVVIAATAGVTVGVAATITVLKKTNVRLLAKEDDIKRLVDEGGRLVFETPRGTMYVHSVL